MSLNSFLRSFKLTYQLSNILNRSKLEYLRPLYKKYGIKKALHAPISYADFKDLPQDDLPFWDRHSLAQSADEHADFQAFSPLIQEGVRSWSEKGYAIIPGYFAQEAEAVNQEIEQLLAQKKIAFRYGNKLMFVWKKSPLIASLGQKPELIRLLSFLLGRPVELFQSINFLQGSEQRAHSDLIHMTTHPLHNLIAVWVALEDIKIPQGALFYYPGSHKLPFVSKLDFEHGGSAFRLGKNAYKAYEDKIEAQIRAKQLKKEYFEAKKGDILIWHANLLHGGSPIASAELSRKSMVFHYYTKDVIRYHEISERPSLMQ